MSGPHVWKAFDRAIETAIAEQRAYPEKASFVDAEEPTAGKQIARALDDGYAVVLVSADGSERVLDVARSAA